MNYLKTLQLIAIIIASFSGCFCRHCDLQYVEGCLNTPDDVIERLVKNPLDFDLLTTIKVKHCVGQPLARCKELMLSPPADKCEETKIAPYNLLISALEHVCSSGIDLQATCLKNTNIQNEMAACFSVLQRNLLYPGLDNNKICCSYVSADLCVKSVSMQDESCSDRDSNTLIHSLLAVRTNAWTKPLQCPAYA